MKRSQLILLIGALMFNVFWLLYSGVGLLSCIDSFSMAIKYPHVEFRIGTLFGMVPIVVGLPIFVLMVCGFMVNLWLVRKLWSEKNE